MRKVKIAATQFACSLDRKDNIKKAEDIVRKAASKGAQIILLQELFQSMYFCQTYDNKHFKLAKSAEEDPGYYEKYYFCPGNTGFRVWDTSYGKIGIGICWDQWYPE